MHFGSRHRKVLICDFSIFPTYFSLHSARVSGSTQSATSLLNPTLKSIAASKKLLEGDNLAVCRVVNWNLPSHCKPFFEHAALHAAGDIETNDKV